MATSDWWPSSLNGGLISLLGVSALLGESYWRASEVMDLSPRAPRPVQLAPKKMWRFEEVARFADWRDKKLGRA